MVPVGSLTFKSRKEYVGVLCIFLESARSVGVQIYIYLGIILKNRLSASVATQGVSKYE